MTTRATRDMFDELYRDRSDDFDIFFLEFVRWLLDLIRYALAASDLEGIS